MPQFFDFKQVCEVLHLSRARVNQLRTEGKFPRPHKLAPGRSGRVIWPAEAIHAWLAARAPKASA
jgi:predicted DNA-binding transcriptional regulator AlpA